MRALEELNARILACERCPRLRQWCEQVAKEKRRAFQDEEYWGRPVPNFGDPQAVGLIVGLAPAAHGANRTGRMFTGDRSGEWLYRALHRAGLANQAESVSVHDNLRLKRVMVTAVAHCAPPGNKPTPGEVTNCRSHFEAVLSLRPWRAFLCLGSIAWGELFRALKTGGNITVPNTPCLGNAAVPTERHPPRWETQEESGRDRARPSLSAPKFGHGATYVTTDGAVVIASYHPSQQNTFTGRLTEKMLDDAVAAFASFLG